MIVIVATSFQYASILEKAEENIYKITNVLLKQKSEDKTQQTVTIDRMGLVSLTVLKAKGKDLPFTFPATYGSVILPYFETFQDTVGGEQICVNVSKWICQQDFMILSILTLYFFL